MWPYLYTVTVTQTDGVCYMNDRKILLLQDGYVHLSKIYTLAPVHNIYSFGPQ